MDPSRIRLEDDRFGLISLSFRSQNRATFMGRDGDDLVWAVGIVVGDEDEIQTVEIDQHGAKSSRMLTPGEVFDGLEVLASPGEEANVIVGTVTLLGMDLRARNAETAQEFAEILRAAADDRDWRLPLHLIGQPRDLQLSIQGREILRQTASSIEQEGQARTSLSAASRLELSSQALESIRRRIARKSLQAYRMHGRWYVVLDNLSRSRSSELNGTSPAAVPQTSPEPPSPFEEAPVEPEVESQQVMASEIGVEEPFVAPGEPTMPEEGLQLEEEQGEPEPTYAPTETQPEAPTEDDLAAFVSEPIQPETEPITQELPAVESMEAEESTGVVSESPVAEEAVAEQGSTEEFLVGQEEPREEIPVTEAEETSESSENHVDEFISESVLDQYVISGAETVLAAETVVETISAMPEAGQEDEIRWPDEGAEEPVTQTDLESATEEAFDVTTEEPSDVEAAESLIAETTRFEAEPEEIGIGLTEEEVSPIAEIQEAPDDGIAASAPEAASEADVFEDEEPSIEGEEALEVEPEAVTEAEMEPQPEAVAAEEAQALQEPVLSEAETEEHVAVAEAEVAEENVELEGISEPEEQAEPTSQVGDEADVLTAEFESEEATEQAEDVEISAEAETGEETEEPSEEPEAQPDFDEVLASARVDGPDLNLLMHLRDEVSYLRQQGQEKDRQIVAWINGAQWLQPFVDQIRALEQQVERLGELQAKRDGDRISDLKSERDTLRDRLESLESEIHEARSAANAADANRRSWFRRMMGSD